MRSPVVQMNCLHYGARLPGKGPPYETTSIRRVRPVFCCLFRSAAVLRRKHDFGDGEKAIARLRSGQANPPPKGAVLFVGSATSFAGNPLAEDFPNHKIINRGFAAIRYVIRPISPIA